MRYNHYGIGHSAMLQKIIRDSLGSELVASHVNGEDVDSNSGMARATMLNKKVAMTRRTMRM